MATDSDDVSTGMRRATIPREHDAPRLLIVLMIVLMLLGVAGAYVGMQRTGIADHVLGRPATFAGDGPIFTVEQVFEEPAKVNLVGRQVAIWGAAVQQVSGDWLFWIGADADHAVPVVLLGEQTARQQERQTEVDEGDVVAVFGTVYALRDVSSVVEARALPADERARLTGAQIYISALRVEEIRRRE